MKSVAVIIIFSIVLVVTNCCSPTTSAPPSQSPASANLSMKIEKFGKMRKQLEEGIDRQVEQTRSDLGKLNEQKRLKSLGDELKHVSADAFLDSIKLDLTTKELRQKVETNLTCTIRLVQQQTESDNERICLDGLHQQLMDVCMVVFAKS